MTLSVGKRSQNRNKPSKKVSNSNQRQVAITAKTSSEREEGTTAINLGPEDEKRKKDFANSPPD